MGLNVYFFFFNDTATTEIYTLSLHDALPIWSCSCMKTACSARVSPSSCRRNCRSAASRSWALIRSEEHTSELQSRQYLVCRLLLEKKQYPMVRLLLYNGRTRRSFRVEGTHAE